MNSIKEGERVTLALADFLNRRGYPPPSSSTSNASSPIDPTASNSSTGTHLTLRRFSDFKMVQSTAEMALRKSVSCDSGVVHPVKLCGQQNINRIEEEYGKFKNFVAEAVEPYKTELTHCLWPVFINAYIDLVISENRPLLQRFDSLFRGLFTGVDAYRILVDAIAGISNYTQLSSCQPLKEFREHKAHVKLSPETWGYLERFLESHLYIMNIFNHHIDVNIQLSSLSSHPPSRATITSSTLPPAHLIQARHLIDSLSITNLATWSKKAATNGTVKSKKSVKTEENGSLNGDHSNHGSEYGSTTATPTPLEAHEVASNSSEKINGSSYKGSDSLGLLRQSIDKCRNLHIAPNMLMFTVDCRFMESSVASIAETSLASNEDYVALGMDTSVIALQRLQPFKRTKKCCDKWCNRQKKNYVKLHPSAYYPSSDSEEECPEPEPTSDCSILVGHSGPVCSVGFLPSSKLLLSASEDTTVRAWDVDTDSAVALYKGHQYPIWDLSISRQGLYFATGSQDSTVRLWCSNRNFPLRIYAGHSGDVDKVEFHPNCNYLASASSDRSIRLWSVQSAAMVRVFPMATRGQVNSLCFSPNGQWLASAGEDRLIKVWDLKNCQLYKELRGHEDTITSVVFSKCASLLISTSLDGSVKLWDMTRCALSKSADNCAVSNSAELLYTLTCPSNPTYSSSSSNYQQPSSSSSTPSSSTAPYSYQSQYSSSSNDSTVKPQLRLLSFHERLNVLNVFGVLT